MSASSTGAVKPATVPPRSCRASCSASGIICPQGAVLLAVIGQVLYQQGRLSIGKAQELIGMSLWQFRQLLGSRKISPHFGVEEYREDLETLRELGLL